MVLVMNRFRPLARQIGSYTKSKKSNQPNRKGFVSDPSRGRQVSILYPYETEVLFRNEKFPAPREVDRYLYLIKMVKKHKLTSSFRPLARQIGSYTQFSLIFLAIFKRFRPLARLIGSYTIHPYLFSAFKQNPFPSPLEVDRELYELQTLYYHSMVQSFRPLTRQIGIYTEVSQSQTTTYHSFPAPREVHRYLYKNNVNKNALTVNRFPAPLEVERYLYYFELRICMPSTSNCFRPLSRQIGSYTTSTRMTLHISNTSFRPLARQIGIYTYVVQKNYS